MPYQGYVVTGVIVILGLAILLLLIKHIIIVHQAEKVNVERLGAYRTTWDVGIHFLVPFIDKVVARISTKEQVVDYDPQPVITKDNVTIKIDTVVFFQIMDARYFQYGAERPLVALENLTATTLRNLIGELDLDETLTSHDTINTKLRSILDEATDPWGIKVNRVEVKDIDPPREIKAAMEKQMKAEREKREQVLRAEAEKQSKILQAEGEKESEILRADAEKQATVLKADAEKQAMILKAEAESEAILKVKNAEAEGIRLIREAEAEGYKQLVNANVSQEVLTLKSFEAWEKVADGKSTKIIIPSDIQNMAATLTALNETIKDTKKEAK